MRALRFSWPLFFALLPGAAAGACPSEGQYVNRTVIQEGPLRFVLATDAALYDVGDPIQILIAAENTGTQPATIPNPSLITPMWASAIVPEECLSLSAPCWEEAIFWQPKGVLFFGTPIPLNPGECAERFLAWDGLIQAPHPDAGELPPSAVYAVFGGFFSGGWPFAFHAPLGGLRVTITVADPVPSGLLSWGMVKDRYGQD